MLRRLWIRPTAFALSGTILVLTFALSVVPSLSEPPGGTRAPRIGLYTFFGERLTADAVTEPTPGLFDFVRFAGYDTVEFCDWSFEYPVSDLPAYFETSAKLIDQAREAKLQVFIILLTNMSRARAIRNSREPDPSKKGSLLFNPQSEPEEYGQRLEDVETALQRAYSAADGFEVFAGDWGGCLEENCDVDQYLRFARDYGAILNRLGLGDRELSLNLWAIANWGESMSPGRPDFWDAEIDLSRRILAKDISFADAVTLAGHHLYRYYAFQVYQEAGLDVPTWPTPLDVRQARKKVTSVYLWPHFLVDDDRARLETWRKAHFEFRYIKKLAEDMRRLNLDGAFANAYAPGPQMANIFAFARFLRDPDRSVESVYLEFAELLTAPPQTRSLAQVFAFLENQSVWSRQLPESFRLPPLDSQLGSAAEALRTLARLDPLQHSPAPLLMSPPDYFQELRESLEVLPGESFSFRPR